MEMTGLNPDSDRVIEVAIVVTDADLDVIAEGPALALHQEERILPRHGQLEHRDARAIGIDRTRAGIQPWTRKWRRDRLLEFLAPLVPRGKAPMCGNSICQDRRFMARWMPRLEAYFHYRNVDVSTLKELARRWQPDVHRSFEKKSRHEALADIYESIDELKHYRAHFLRV